MKIKRFKKKCTTAHRIKAGYTSCLDTANSSNAMEAAPQQPAAKDISDIFRFQNAATAMNSTLTVKVQALLRQLQLAKDFLEYGCRDEEESILKFADSGGNIKGSQDISELLDDALATSDTVIRLAVALLCSIGSDRCEVSAPQEVRIGPKTDVLWSARNDLENVEVRNPNGLASHLRASQQSLDQEILLLKDELSIANEKCNTKDREIERLTIESKALSHNLNERLRQAEAEVQKQHREQKKLRDNLQKIREKYDSYKADTLTNAALLRLVYRRYGELNTQVERLQRECQSAQLGAERIKGHLSYRLGNILVKNANSLHGYLSLPHRLISEHRKFKAERSIQQLPRVLTPVNGDVAADRVLFLRAKSPNIISYAFSVGQSLTLDISAPVLGKVVEFQILSTDMSDQPIGELILPNGERKLLTNSATAITLGAGRDRVVIAPTVSGIFDVEFRVVSGLPAILIIRPGDIIGRSSAVKRSERNVKANGPEKSSSADGADVLPQAVDISQVICPKPLRNGVISQAHALMEQGYKRAGIQFAEAHARSEIRSAIALLRANTCLDDDEMWLNSINGYIERFGAAPIRLELCPGDRFSRLTTDPLPIVERGPLITVIMPAFNSAATIRHAVESILQQSWKSIELLIIDDCSSDSTWTVLKELGRADARIKLFRNRNNVGPYVSKNTALMHAKGAYITGHDADDWAHPDRLRRQVEFLLNGKGKYLANVAKMLRIQKNGKFSFISRENSISPDGILREAAISCMFERKFFSKYLGYWDCVRFGADSEMMSRARRIMGEKFQRVDILSMLCLDEEGSLTNDPEHGISKTSGVSPVRQFYKDQWTTWHQTVTATNSRIDFPYVKRDFVAPDAAVVPIKAINENIANVSLS